MTLLANYRLKLTARLFLAEHPQLSRSVSQKGKRQLPIVKIHIIKGRSAEEKALIADSIHNALVESFRIPENDRHQIIQEYSESNFQRPKGKTERFILIELIVFPGRSKETKKSYTTP